MKSVKWVPEKFMAIGLTQWTKLVSDDQFLVN